MARIRRIARTHRLALMKTGTYYVLHITVAAAVAYAVTRNFWAALTLSLLEPTVQAVAYFFHERAWARVAQRRRLNERVKHPHAAAARAA
ncbi:MAG: DUF2061 domain-containing protein [Tepidimonas sp.]|uniref:DUF2061 domain-containing protein n=1 Tax=Tepidimonas sp. TaxID=2002775 RepID=UPI004054E018